MKRSRIPTEMKRRQQEYELWLMRTVSWKSYYNYSKQMEKFFTLYPKTKRPDDIGLNEVEAFKKRMEGSQLSKGYVQYILATLRAFWNWMIDKGYAFANPFSQKLRPESEFI